MSHRVGPTAAGVPANRREPCGETSYVTPISEETSTSPRPSDVVTHTPSGSGKNSPVVLPSRRTSDMEPEPFPACHHTVPGCGPWIRMPPLLSAPDRVRAGRPSGTR